MAQQSKFTHWYSKAILQCGSLDADVKARVEESLKKLKKWVRILVEIDLNMTEAYVPTYYLIAPAEASSTCHVTMVFVMATAVKIPDF